MIGKLRSAVALSALILMSACQPAEQPVEMRLWATDQSPPPDTPVQGHPCGSVVTITSTHIPADLDWADYEVVYRIDSDGRVLREWRTPVDYYPIGSDGDELFLNVGSGSRETLVVEIDGTVSRLSERLEPAMTVEACPEGFGRFEDSVYVRCLVHPDNDGTFLAYESPCT